MTHFEHRADCKQHEAMRGIRCAEPDTMKRNYKFRFVGLHKVFQMYLGLRKRMKGMLSIGKLLALK